MQSHSIDQVYVHVNRIACLGNQMVSALPSTEHARIARAVAIVIAGGVDLYPNHCAIVASQSGAHAYTVSGDTCECPDAARHPDARCKHVYARILASQAQWVHTHARYATLEDGTWGIAWPTKNYQALWFLADGHSRVQRVTLADVVVAGKVAAL